MATAEQEQLCAKCGNALVRIVEGPAPTEGTELRGYVTVIPKDPSEPWPEELRREEIVLVGMRLKRTWPPYACVTCQPDWKKVHKLAIRQKLYLLTSVQSGLAHDSDGQAFWNAMADEVEAERDELIARLLQDRYWAGSGWGALLPDPYGMCLDEEDGESENTGNL